MSALIVNPYGQGDDFSAVLICAASKSDPRGPLSRSGNDDHHPVPIKAGADAFRANLGLRRFSCTPHARSERVATQDNQMVPSPPRHGSRCRWQAPFGSIEIGKRRLRRTGARTGDPLIKRHPAGIDFSRGFSSHPYAMHARETCVIGGTNIGCECLRHGC